MSKKIKNQRIIGFILSFIVILGLCQIISLVIPVSAEGTGIQNFKYKISNGEVTILGYIDDDMPKMYIDAVDSSGKFVPVPQPNLTQPIIEIPAMIEGYPVKVIGNSAFYYCPSLTSVIIPDGGCNKFL